MARTWTPASSLPGLHTPGPHILCTPPKHNHHLTLTCVIHPQFGGEDLDPSTSTLWFAGKQMAADKKLCDYLGRNDRTKVVVRLQKKGQGAPGREPVRGIDVQKGFGCAC